MSKKVLKAVNVNADGSPARKRARVSEADPGCSSSSNPWVLTKGELNLNDIRERGIGRLDCGQVEDEEDTIFSKAVDVDVSCVSMTPDTRGKQLSILESALTKESLDKLTVGEWNNVMTVRPPVRLEEKMNYFDSLSDEMVLQVLKWLPKINLRDVALTCSRFYRLSNDESLWTRMDVSNKHLNMNNVGVILSRQVIVLRMAKSTISDHPMLNYCMASNEDFRSRLMYLDLSMATVSCDTMVVIFNKCRKIKKISLENVFVNDEVLLALSANTNLEVINMSMALGVREDGLRYLFTNCQRIRELNMAWTYLNMACVEIICSHLPSTMDRINLAGCRKMLMDNSVEQLVSRCPNLRELDLSDCTVITAMAIRYITNLRELTFIGLSRCYMIPHEALVDLRNLTNLSYLDVHGGYLDRAQLNEVQQSLGQRVQLNQFRFSSVARPTVGLRRSSIWNMRVRD